MSIGKSPVVSTIIPPAVGPSPITNFFVSVMELGSPALSVIPCLCAWMSRLICKSHYYGIRSAMYIYAF